MTKRDMEFLQDDSAFAVMVPEGVSYWIDGSDYTKGIVKAVLDALTKHPDMQEVWVNQRHMPGQHSIHGLTIRRSSKLNVRQMMFVR